jgi:hydroxyacylglutathione hydrolase
VSGPSVRVEVVRVSAGRMKNLCYVVTPPEGGQAILVDPAWQMDRIEEALAGAPVTGILLTHAHHDHVNLAAAFAARHRAAVLMSRSEADFHHFRTPALEAFTDGPLRLGGLLVHPLPTPGHTCGSTSYLIGDALFTGDTLFTEGCGICVGRGASAWLLFESLQLLKTVVPGRVRVFPGHSFGLSPGATMESLRKTNIYLGFRDAPSFVRFRMRPDQPQYRFF